ncbi:CoA-disulfide reductase [Halobacillus alkaliphilus]|uniref:CoA-disulfide reductase n=2 Tax=Halobacillus alkaliphilus TaxID=396056 RepID=A0A1I2KG79_9BACI|nr:FAD-dependent oxidoreductase [Halobacillus alkaliphilus]SFF63946.1 CoA-disulfide reductase [Halobacillus alkaliphilus]
MMGRKIIIVGGVAGGATAAARLRRLSEEDEIIVLEKGEYISYANCGLPYYIGGIITDRDALLVQTVEGMSKKFKLDIRNLSEAVEIDRELQTLTIKNLKTGTVYKESYDKLILSPGARPIIPNLEGYKEASNIFTLRSVPDTDQIKHWIDERKTQEAVIIGGGFIGLEMAENLMHQGIKVSLVELGNQVMSSLDYEMSAIVYQELLDQGVNVITEDGVKAFRDQGNIVELQSGRLLSSDLTILSIGVRAENDLAKTAGLSTGKRGGIIVNEHLQTEDKNIYAIGDAIEVKDYIQQTQTMVPLAWPANRQGRLVADHIHGKAVSYNGTLGTSVAKVFDLTVAATGNNAKLLEQLGIPFEAVHVHPSSNASYYPGGRPLSLKLLFDPNTGKIFGAQAVGVKGVEKRIDVIATAIKGNLTVEDLADLELSYAPPYSSAKDPVNMAGYVAANIVDKELSVVHYDKIDEIVAWGGVLLDVREPEEREHGYINGSINIPLGQLRERRHELPKNHPIYVTCQVGMRGYLAVKTLMNYGYQAINLSGGYKTYEMVQRIKKKEALPL